MAGELSRFEQQLVEAFAVFGRGYVLDHGEQYGRARALYLVGIESTNKVLAQIKASIEAAGPVLDLTAMPSVGQYGSAGGGGATFGAAAAHPTPLHALEATVARQLAHYIRRATSLQRYLTGEKPAKPAPVGQETPPPVTPSLSARLDPLRRATLTGQDARALDEMEPLLLAAQSAEFLSDWPRAKSFFAAVVEAGMELGDSTAWASSLAVTGALARCALNKAEEAERRRAAEERERGTQPPPPPDASCGPDGPPYCDHLMREVRSQAKRSAEARGRGAVGPAVTAASVACRLLLKALQVTNHPLLLVGPRAYFHEQLKPLVALVAREADDMPRLVSATERGRLRNNVADLERLVGKLDEQSRRQAEHQEQLLRHHAGQMPTIQPGAMYPGLQPSAVPGVHWQFPDGGSAAGGGGSGSSRVV